jgi:hypothetical protein
VWCFSEQRKTTSGGDTRGWGFWGCLMMVIVGGVMPVRDMFSCIWVLAYRSFGLDLESAQLACKYFGENCVFPPRACELSAS